MASRILQDSGILELLNCLRSTSSASDASPDDPEASPNAECPEQVKEEQDNGRSPDDISLLDWPAFIRQQIPVTSLKVILHAIHSDDWARAGTKTQLTGRLLTLFVRFGLGTRVEEPWMLFLYLGQTVPFTIRLVKSLNAWMTENGHVDPLIVPLVITTQAINRHGRENLVPYQIVDVDIERAMQHLAQQYPRPSPPAVARTSSRLGGSSLSPQLEQRSNTGVRVVPSGSPVPISPRIEAINTEHGQVNRASNRRKRPRQVYRESSAGSTTPEAGRRAAEPAPFTSPLTELRLSSLNRLVSPSPNARLSGGIMFNQVNGQASPYDHDGTLRLRARLEALRAVIELGPATEVDADSPLARQTRGLLDSITRLAELAFDTIGEAGDGNV
ncbi:hypothetical protein F66182_6322 [Fusarium sp. NRRL 66182]|nr:hypothetical protein F66182_6322 [Fusarium sp. NRRL 66182]